MPPDASRPTEDVVRRSGNVFRDFGVANPDVRQWKALLAAEISKTLDRSTSRVSQSIA
jgi:hypothetical protein